VEDSDDRVHASACVYSIVAYFNLKSTVDSLTRLAVSLLLAATGKI